MIKFRFLMTVLQGSRRANEMLRRHRRPSVHHRPQALSSEDGQQPRGWGEPQAFKGNLGRAGFLSANTLEGF